jgi:transposase
MDPIAIVGLDLAKRVFQVHGARADGSVILRKKLSRAQVLTFFAQLPPCVVAMEACASAHEWGRAIRKLGHEVRLIPPAYVKPFIKRQKNDAADAEAIAEAAARPTMRFVAVKSESQQARAMIFRTRDLLVRQRTQLINALRGHLAEHGVVEGGDQRAPARLGDRRCCDIARSARRRSEPPLSRPDPGPRHPDFGFGEAGLPGGQANRRDVTPHDDARNRTDHRNGDRDVRAADGDVQARA